MPDLSAAILAKLRTNHLTALSLDEEMLAPAYAGLSITNLPASICQWLGVNGWPTTPLDNAISSALKNQYRQVILLVVDGLGYEKYRQLLQSGSAETEEWKMLSEEALTVPLTSIVPSTTSAALTTFWTGRAPSEHGITGYEMWLQEYSITANMILLSPSSFVGGVGSLGMAGFKPDQFLDVETLGPFLRKNGVHPFALQHESITRSGLSTMLMKDTESIAYRTIPDLWVTLEHRMQETSSEQRYIYAYWGDLDEIQHLYGPQDQRVEDEFLAFLEKMNRFIRRAQKADHADTLFLLTADHGQIATPKRIKNELRRYPQLLQGLHILPAGENRLAYLYLKPGHEKDTLDMIETLWPGHFLAVPAEQAAAAGLFGPRPYHPQLGSRIGDLILIPRGNQYLWWANKENRMLGRHGGLSSAEMLVPLVAFTL